MTEDARVQLDELIDKFDYAMLVTRSLEGSVRARPMVIAGHKKGGTLYFATRIDNGKLGEIINDPNVGITLQGGRRFVSISGRAEVESDPDVVRSLWTMAMKVWFPDGVEDPHLIVIKVEPDYAEFWDEAGFNYPVVLWEAGKALLKGETPSEDPTGSHAKISEK